MVDILMTSSEEKMHQTEDFEDGELVEDGEICDDDEEEVKPAAPAVPTLASVKIISPPKGAWPSPRREEIRKPASSPPEKKSSRDDLKEKEKESKPTIPRAADLWKATAAEDNYVFGGGEEPPRRGRRVEESARDSDYRTSAEAPGATVDKDYRWNDPAASIAAPDNGDFDYRERRRRVRSPSPPSHAKRSRASPPNPFADGPGGAYADIDDGFRGGAFRGRGGFRGRGRGRGGYQGPGGDPRWMERHICKFFREGFCRDGDHCSYSHNAEDSKRRPELCKFYQMGFCKKGLACHHLHGEFPCKAFHKGECTRDNCNFSHQPLTDYTRPMFEDMMRMEEFDNNRMAASSAAPGIGGMGGGPPPLRRRTLLPGGPPSVPVGGPPGPGLQFPPGYVPSNGAAAAMAAASGGGGPPQGPSPAVAAATAAAAKIFPKTLLPEPTPPTQSAMDRLPPGVLPPPTVVVPLLAGPLPAAAPEPPSIPIPAPAPAPGSIDISQMLAQIAGASFGTSVSASTAPSIPAPIYEPPKRHHHDPFSALTSDFLDAPASPPPMEMDIPLPGYGLRHAKDVVYRLIPVEVDPPYTGMSPSIITGGHQADPRIARLLACQFDAVSSMIAQAQQQPPAPAPPPTPSAPAPTAQPRPVDPRMRDPRRRQEVARDQDERQRVSWMPQIS